MIPRPREISFFYEANSLTQHIHRVCADDHLHSEYIGPTGQVLSEDNAYSYTSRFFQEEVQVHIDCTS